MWFRYLISFLDIGLAGLMTLYAMKATKEEKAVSILVAFITISSVVLMWR